MSLEKLALTLIALGTMVTFLLVAAYMAVNHPDHELTTMLMQTLATVGVAGIFAYFFTKSQPGGGA